MIRRRREPRVRMDMSQLALPKPEPRSRTKRRAKRREADIVQTERPACVARDGYCRLAYASADRGVVERLFGACSGPSEWSHYNKTHRRSKTVGMDPALRHDRKHSMMLCRYHSHEYDQNRMTIDELTSDGCDGRLAFERDGQRWEEPTR